MTFEKLMEKIKDLEEGFVPYDRLKIEQAKEGLRQYRLEMLDSRSPEEKRFFMSKKDKDVLLQEVLRRAKIQEEELKEKLRQMNVEKEA